MSTLRIKQLNKVAGCIISISYKNQLYNCDSNSFSTETLSSKEKIPKCAKMKVFLVKVRKCVCKFVVVWGLFHIVLWQITRISQESASLSWQINSLIFYEKTTFDKFSYIQMDMFSVFFQYCKMFCLVVFDENILKINKTESKIIGGYMFFVKS